MLAASLAGAEVAATLKDPTLPNNTLDQDTHASVLIERLVLRSGADRGGPLRYRRNLTPA